MGGRGYGQFKIGIYEYQFLYSFLHDRIFSFRMEEGGSELF